ncbi:MAG: signal recognition particle protein [Anaerorhabdus sp.]
MAFDSLSKKLNKSFRNLVGKGRLTEKNIEEMLREIRVALLEADVNYHVVKDFLEKVRDKVLGMDVLEAVDPSEMIVKLVHDEMVTLLGGEEKSEFKLSEEFPIVMFVGLQGTGKTTSVAKLAHFVKNKGNKKPLLVAADLARPAAIEQLQTLGKQIGVDVFAKSTDTPVVEVVKQAMEYAKGKDYDCLFIDTAGRLHIDEILMQELCDIKALTNPDEILLTVDAMTGQDIVNVAQSFHEQLEVTGLIATKFDGDARGGGVLSVRAMTQVPVYFVGQGERIQDIEPFYPERMADRILGMGDIVTLVEQAQEKMDLEASEAAAKKMMDGTFTMDDMLAQLEQVSKMGPIGGLLKMIPGLNQLTDMINDADAEKGMKKQKAIIQSMTREERSDPSILNSRRKNRIANGSGSSLKEVSQLVNQFERTKKGMKQMMGMAQSGQMPDLGSMFGNKK